MVCCCFSLQTPCLAKFLASFGPKCSQPIKLQDCLTINLSRIELWVILIFSVRIVIPESKKPRLPFRKSVVMYDYLPIWLQYFLLKIWLVWKFSVEKVNKWGEYLIDISGINDFLIFSFILLIILIFWVQIKFQESKNLRLPI